MSSDCNASTDVVSEGLLPEQPLTTAPVKMRAFISLPMPNGERFLANRRHILGIQMHEDSTLSVYVMNITDPFTVPSRDANATLRAIEGNYDRSEGYSGPRAKSDAGAEMGRATPPGF
jgi:hypothetical protein